jgi:hypothetical protein
MSKRSNKEEFLSKIKLIPQHKGKGYTYENFVYITNKTKSTVTCPKHGDFELRPNHHLSGYGCPKCGFESMSKSKTKSVDQFLIDVSGVEKHKDKYEYKKPSYVNAKTPMDIRCIPCDFWFKQNPDNHLSGRGCPKCCNNISDPELAFLDYLTVPKRSTNRQVRIGRYKVDGLVKSRNTIYEYLGSFYHGDPRKFDKNDVNPKTKITYGELYEKTFERFDKLVDKTGHKIKYIWGLDWIDYQKGLVKTPKIHTYKR